LSLEGEEWFEPDKIASLADIFVNNRGSLGGQKAPEGRTARVATAAPAETRGNSGTHNLQDECYGPEQGSAHTFHSSPERRCYRCNGTGHFARVCPSNRGGYQRSYRGSHQGEGSSSFQRGGARVNVCSTLGTPQLRSRDIGVQCGGDDDVQVNLVTQPRWEFGEFPSVGVTTVKTLPTVRVYPLHYVDVSVAGVECVALEDSGCQIPIVSNRLFGQCSDRAIGKVDLHGFGKGHTIQAPLVDLTVRLRDDAYDCDVVHEIPTVCAITDLGTTEYDAILPAELVRGLQRTDLSVSTCDTDGVVTVAEEAPIDSPMKIENVIGVDILPQDEIEDGGSEFVSEQKADAVLRPFYAQSVAEKRGFAIHQELLNHKDQIDGQPVSQFCITQGQSDNVLRPALESVFGVSDVDSDSVHVLTPTVDVLSCVLPSNWDDEDKLSHLESSQCRDLQRLLDEFPDRFANMPDLCDAAVHRVQTFPEFYPCQRCPYHVADLSKPKVDRQIRELFGFNLSRSPVSSNPTTNLLQPYIVRSTDRDVRKFDIEFHTGTVNRLLCQDWLSRQI